VLVDGQVTDFVNHQDGGPQILLLFADEAACFVRGQEGVDDFDGGGEEHAVSGKAGGVAERDAQMGFSQADAADQDRIGFVLDELEPEEILDLSAVDPGRPSEDKLLQRLDDREARLLNAPLRGAVLALVCFAFDQAAEELHV
jgi:hypothetical protein